MCKKFISKTFKIAQPGSLPTTLASADQCPALSLSYFKPFQNKDDLQEEMQQAFRIFDGTSDGFISREELKFGLEKLDTILGDKEIDEVRLKAVVAFSHENY